MFMTQIRDEVLMGQVLGPHKFWKMVEHPGTTPWLYVRVQFSRPGTMALGSRYFCCSDLDLIQSLLQEGSDFCAVTDVMLVTPEDSNSGTLPRRELVAELAVAFDRVTKERVHVCLTEKGNIYHFGTSAKSPDLVEYKVLYPVVEGNPEG